MNHYISIFLSILSILSIGCNNDDFSPYSDLDAGLVTYCMLDTRNNIQFVRVQKKHFTQNAKILEDKAQVLLSENLGDNFVLRDTVMPGFENYNMYYISSFSPKRTAQYRLTVRQDTFIQYSYVNIPPVSNISVTLKMDTFYTPLGIMVQFTFQAEFPNTSPSVSCVKLFIDYEIDENNKTNKRIIEIPIEVGNIKRRPGSWFLWEINESVHRILGGYTEIFFERYEGKPVVFTTVYPTLVKDRNSVYYKKDASGKVIIPYYAETLYYALKELSSGYDRRKIKINRGFVVFYSVDESYYENIMERKNEEYSIRIDQPIEYTNFENLYSKGTGFMGAIATDTASFKLPRYFIDKFSFIDGQ